jgi:hypothetical protein
MKYKRILLKLSGEALQNKEKGLSIDPAVLASIGRQFKQLIDAGAEIAVVVGGGNIFRGLTGEAGGDRYQSSGPLAALVAIEEYLDFTPHEGFRFGILKPDAKGRLSRVLVQGRHYEVEVSNSSTDITIGEMTTPASCHVRSALRSVMARSSSRLT